MNPMRFLVGICLLNACFAAGADDQLERRLSEKIKMVLPGAKVTSVKPGPIQGLYEVLIGPALLYITDDGRYVVRGDVFDLETKDNITNTRRSQARIAAFESLGVASMIEFGPADGKATRTIYVYTDIDCAYCRKMHQEINQLTGAGIAVRYLAFPRTGLNGDSYNKAVSVWCSANRQQALTDSKLGKTIETKTCENPVAVHYHMGEAMGVHGTPAVYADGQELGGYIPAAELIRMLATGEI